MRARAVIGASFGDEGKGLTVDHLCAQGAGVVVRFNGGAQAGHTVVQPDGRRHIFSHVGSGAFHDVPTFLSQYFICNPILFFQELESLQAVGVFPTVYAHPECLVTTFADMLINQRLEEQRGPGRHGSCGVGIGETIERSLVPELRITMADLWNRASTLPSKLSEICERYAAFRTGKPIDEPKMLEAFIAGCWKFAEYIHPAGIGQCVDPVFEGAQGLLLDQNNKEQFPHVTRSNTGSKNVKALCAQAGITDIDLHYVSRTYLTRHGNGALQGEDSRLSYVDETNVPHEWQGVMRFAKLDDVRSRCKADANGNYRLVLTHCDQRAPDIDADLYSYGPTRNDVRLTRLEAAA